MAHISGVTLSPVPGLSVTSTHGPPRLLGKLVSYWSVPVVFTVPCYYDRHHLTYYTIVHRDRGTAILQGVRRTSNSLHTPREITQMRCDWLVNKDKTNQHVPYKE